MKKLANFSYYRLLIITLGVMLILTSCKQLGLFSNFPTKDEIPSPGGFDPGMELISNYLFCPSIPSTNISIPPVPYDEDIGDCALRGKSTEIEAWLTALEGIAASCQANQETNWVAALAARDNLDAKIDELEEVGAVPTVTVDPEEDETSTSQRDYFLTEFEPVIFPGYSAPGRSNPSPDTGDSPSTHLYTDWLKRIGEDVGEYCTMIDELIKPIWQACDEINFYQEYQAPDPEQYHSIVELRMNIAQTRYDYTDFFYIDTLQTFGWSDFRTSFSSDALDCPLDRQAPNTNFTFYQNAFCRRGPSSEYEEVATFLEGHVVQIVGRNHHEPRWWVIPNPGARGQCWVSDSTGAAEGPLEELEIVAPPPLVINPPSNGQSNTCSQDLVSGACTAAGGKWIDVGVTSSSFICQCP